MGDGKAAYFIRVSPAGIQEKSIDTDIACGILHGSALDNFRALVNEVFLPMLQVQQSWGKVSPEQVQELLGEVQKFGVIL